MDTDWLDPSLEDDDLLVVNNTLGRYIIASLTYRFGTFDRSKMRGGYGGPGGPGRGPR